VAAAGEHAGLAVDGSVFGVHPARADSGWL
jgi:hypothetical protein